jgi:hypothetical protein
MRSRPTTSGILHIQRSDDRLRLRHQVDHPPPGIGLAGVRHRRPCPRRSWEVHHAESLTNHSKPMDISFVTRRFARRAPTPRGIPGGITMHAVLLHGRKPARRRRLVTAAAAFAVAPTGAVAWAPAASEAPAPGASASPISVNRFGVSTVTLTLDGESSTQSTPTVMTRTASSRRTRGPVRTPESGRSQTPPARWQLMRDSMTVDRVAGRRLPG